jgi:Domain of unknown function (DUF4136)
MRMSPGGNTAIRRPRTALTVFAIAVALVIAVQPGAAKVKVRANFDKAFDFERARTWGWNPKGAGDIMVARTPDDDPAAIKRLAEPLIMSAVGVEMPRRGLAQAGGTPDLTVTYYLLLTVGTSAQTLGQFLPAVAQWGLPPFAPVTTSLEFIEQGSLVLDLSAHGEVVWRGVAEAQIKMELNQDKRAALVREAVRKILDRYPPKK